MHDGSAMLTCLLFVSELAFYLYIGVFKQMVHYEKLYKFINYGTPI